MHDHVKHSVYGLLFVLTQYSIIIGILIVLQGLFSMRKRRVAHIIHQHLINKTQRLRSSFSSVSLVRHSFSMDTNGHINHEENKLQKRIISSPAIVIREPSIPQLNTATISSDENEPFLKLPSSKNHVHFFFGVDEGFDDNESNDFHIDSTHNEPYSDRLDALFIYAYIHIKKRQKKENHKTQTYYDLVKMYPEKKKKAYLGHVSIH